MWSMSRCRLRDICRGLAEQWLDVPFDSLGVESTMVTILLTALLWVLISIPVAIAVGTVISFGQPVGRDLTPHGAW